MEQEMAGMPMAPQKRSIKKLIIKIALVIVVFVLALWLGVSWFSGGAVAVSDAFISNVQNLKAPEAYALFTKQAADTVTPEDFKTIVDRVGPILNGTPKNVGKQIGTDASTGAQSTVTYEIAGSDNLTYLLTITLAKEDGAWKILSFESKQK